MRGEGVESSGVSACHAKAAETKGHRRDTGGTPGRTSDPLAVHIVPTPATQKRRRRRDTGGTPGRTSDPLAVRVVPRLPRKSGGDQGTPEGHRRDARAYIRPLGSAHCPTPATQKRRRRRGTPEGRQGVHPTPWQCALSHACHAKAAETKGHRRDTGGDARAYIRPLGSAHCPTPATQKRRRPRDTGGTPEGRRAYIRPLGSAHCPTPAAQKAAETKDTGGTPEGRQGVHPTPWQCTLSHACHAKEAETKGHRRDTGGTPGRTSDPLAVHIVPRLPRKSGGDQGTPEGHRRDARAYIRPLGSAHCPTPATQKRRRPRDTGGTPEGRQGVHPTPWQCTFSHACHAQSGGDQARAYIRPLGSAHCPTPATQKRRRPRD